MRIAFYGGQTAGIIVLLSLIADKHKISCVVAEDENIKKVAKVFGLPVHEKSKLDKDKFAKKLRQGSDLFLCCHGRKILKGEFVRNIKCVNIHPCLYKYKGARPISRLIVDKNPKASVGSHFMTEKVDSGRVIVEKFIKIENIEKLNEHEVYSFLYPLYSLVALETLKRL